jgi:hypothetical protein
LAICFVFKFQNSEEATKVAHVSALEDGETLMILEAPPNISIASVPVSPSRPRTKPAGRRYTKEDLQVGCFNTEIIDLVPVEFTLIEEAPSWQTLISTSLKA